ncbi:MAG: GTPase [Candidatus Woesearchaeota archaeon]
MVNYWKIVNEVIKKSDMIILVLDARYVDDTRNSELEDKIISSGKPILYVINKCDLADRGKLEKSKSLQPSIYISATDHLGTTMLRHKILQISAHLPFSTIHVGIVGYPNVGKSSIINALKGKGAAKVSNVSGYTKHKQNIRISKKIMLIDTPGVIPYMEKDTHKHALIGTINVVKVKNPDLMVISIIENNPGLIEELYGVKTHRNKELVLEDIAKKKGVLLKGGIPDIDRVSKIILQDIQKGKKKQ